MTGDPRNPGEGGDDEQARAAGGREDQSGATADQPPGPPPDATRQEGGGRNPKHVILAGFIVLLVAAGALFLLGGRSGPAGPGATDCGSQSSPQPDDGAGAGESSVDGTLESSLANAVATDEDANNIWDNYTLRIDSTVVDPSGTLVTNQTVRVDTVHNRRLSTTRITVDNGSSITIHRESYRSAGTAYVMRRIAGSENRTFTRTSEASRPDAADLESLEERFDFEYSRTTNDDHR
ncbi:MAG: hypothetical protein V5A24_00810 [Haloarculaceae archaeon]